MVASDESSSAWAGEASTLCYVVCFDNCDTGPPVFEDPGSTVVVLNRARGISFGFQSFFGGRLILTDVIGE